MPLAQEPDRENVDIRFGESVVSELLFLLMDDMKSRSHDPLPPALSERVRGLWEDGLCFWEMLVVAEEADVLHGALTPEELIARLDPACDTVALEQPLRSESPDEREVIRARLRRLKSDKRFRRRYLKVLADVWSFYEAEWLTRRRPVVTRVVDTCRARAARGESTPWHGLVKVHEKSNDILEDGWVRAEELGVATVAICGFGGVLVLDLPGGELISMAVADLTIVDRDRSRALANQLRALADPTRLALVELLASAPRTIGELAVELAVSQPTVSNHVKLLRDAGIVRTGSTSGGRRCLEIDVERTGGLLVAVANAVGVDALRHA